MILTLTESEKDRNMEQICVTSTRLIRQDELTVSPIETESISFNFPITSSRSNDKSI